MGQLDELWYIYIGEYCSTNTVSTIPFKWNRQLYNYWCKRVSKIQ